MNRRFLLVLAVVWSFFMIGGWIYTVHGLLEDDRGEPKVSLTVEQMMVLWRNGYLSGSVNALTPGDFDTKMNIDSLGMVNIINQLK